MIKSSLFLNLLCLIFVYCGFCAQLSAEPDEDFLEGFDDFQVRNEPEPIEGDEIWQFGGHIALLTSYSYALDKQGLDSAAAENLNNYSGFSKLQTLLRLHANIQLDQWRIHAEGKAFQDWFYDHKGKSRFPDSVLDEHDSELEWHEFYLQGQLTEDLDVKIGRQLLPWGRSDNVRVLDLLNPLDLREPGSTDIEEIRLPVGMTRIDYSMGFWTLNLIAIHEVRFNKLPAAGSEFQPKNRTALSEIKPSGGWAAERACSLTGVFPGWDLSIHYAKVYEDEPYLDFTVPTAPLRRHNRLSMTGFAFNRIYGSWLLKGEYARLGGFTLSTDPGTRHSRTDILLGIEYAGLADTQIALETSVQHLHDWQSRFQLPPDYRSQNEMQTALRFNRSFANDHVNAVVVALVRGSGDGGIFRASLEYTPMDGLNLSTGIVLYTKGNDPPFSELGNRDRLLLGLKYYF